MRKLKNRRAISEDEVIEEMIKVGGNMVVDWFWRLCNMSFESGVVSEDGGLLRLFHFTRVKERGLYVGINEVLAS